VLFEKAEILPNPPKKSRFGHTMSVVTGSNKKSKAKKMLGIHAYGSSKLQIEQSESPIAEMEETPLMTLEEIITRITNPDLRAAKDQEILLLTHTLFCSKELCVTTQRDKNHFPPFHTEIS